MKIVFLDVDGVLNNTEYARYRTQVMGCRSGYGGDFKEGEPVTKENVGWDPQNVEALNHILHYFPDVFVVISSTWRHYFGLETFNEMFELYGLPDVLIGETADLDEPRPGGYVWDRYVNQTIRGKEVKAWLDEMNTSMGVDSYVILDDYAQFLPEQQDHFVQTDPTVGLTMDDALKAIEILEGEKNNNYEPTSILGKPRC